MSSLLRSPICNLSTPPSCPPHLFPAPLAEKNRAFPLASPRPLFHLSEKHDPPKSPNVGRAAAHTITYNEEEKAQIQRENTETEGEKEGEGASGSGSNRSSEEIIKKESRLFVPTYSRFPVVFAKGYGCKLYDVEGKEYIDMCAGIAVNALGHGDKAWVDAITEQASLLSHVSNVYHSEPQVKLAERLLDSCFADRVFFCNSGTEANEAAIKFARKYQRTKLKETKKLDLKLSESGQDTEGVATGFVAFTNSFHGRTLGSLALTSKEKYREPFEPIMPGVEFIGFGDLEAARKAIQPGRTAAVFVEPVQGEGGIYPATLSFLKGLREHCDETGSLLVFDEVQCGLGRTGRMWAYEHYGVKPDMMTVAKPLAGGLPIGAVLVKEAVSSAVEYGDHGSTFAGGPLVCKAALAVLDRIQEPGFLEAVEAKGKLLLDLLKEKLGNNSHVKEVRGLGLLVGVELHVPASPLVKAALQHGLLALTAGKGDILRLVPPLTISEHEIERGVDILAQCMPALDL